MKKITPEEMKAIRKYIDSLTTRSMIESIFIRTHSIRFLREKTEEQRIR